MREALMVSGLTFKTKKALEEKLRSILHAAMPGVELDEPEDSFLLCVLFRHPEAVEKIGPGVRAFRVTTSKYKNRCFEAVRVDGTSVEFSYVKCAKGENDDEPGDSVAMEQVPADGGPGEPGSIRQGNRP